MSFVPAAPLAPSRFAGDAPVLSPRRPCTRPVAHPSARRCAPAALLRAGGDGGGGRAASAETGASAAQAAHPAGGADGADGSISVGKDGVARHRRVFLVGNLKVVHESARVETVEAEGGGAGGGLFGVQAKAYWESMGVLPLSFAAFGVTALALKLIKVKKGEWSAGDGGVNRAVTHESIVTSEAEEAELHVYKCGGCGYEIYPARGREFKFFPDDFKCPLCQSPKSAFWDLNDPEDPRNQEEDEDEDEDGGHGAAGGDDGDGGLGGPGVKSVVGQQQQPTTVAGETGSDSETE